MNDAYYKFVDSAKDYACGIYKQFPGALVPNPSDAGYKQIWDKLCYTPPPSDPNLPPPPTEPFPGGQCMCILYKFPVFVNGQFGDNPRVFGPIGNFRIRYAFPETEQSGRAFYEVLCRGTLATNCLPTPTWIAIAEGANIRRGDNPYSFGSIVRNDGQPDTCGNPPKKYPDAPPPPPRPKGYISPPTPIEDNDGDVNNYTFNFYPPQKIDFPDVPFPPIVISVGGDNVDLDFDINFNFNGDISFTRPGGGNDLSPGLAGGFQNLGDGIAGVSGGVGGLQNDFGGFAGTLGGVASSLGGVGASLDNLAGKLDFKFAPPPFINAPEIDKEVEEVTGGGKQDENKEGLLGILVTLTTPAKEVIFGNPNVYFAGWLTFFSQGGYEVREPIHFEKSYFPAPDGATGYGLTFTKGAKGTITVFSKPIPE